MYSMVVELLETEEKDNCTGCNMKEGRWRLKKNGMRAVMIPRCSMRIYWRFRVGFGIWKRYLSSSCREAQYLHHSRSHHRLWRSPLELSSRNLRRNWTRSNGQVVGRLLLLCCGAIRTMTYRQFALVPSGNISPSQLLFVFLMPK